MTEPIQCARCSRQAVPPAKVPHAPKIAAEILTKTCAACWAEWEGMEVMVINELRLDFMDPGSLVVLERHCREFLILGEAPSA